MAALGVAAAGFVFGAAGGVAVAQKDLPPSAAGHEQVNHVTGGHLTVKINCQHRQTTPDR
jgi:hypothetical protein